MNIFDRTRKGQIFLWKMYDGSKCFYLSKGKIYGKLQDCVYTDLEREYRELTGADLSVCYQVTRYPGGCYSVLVRVRKDCRKDKFLRMKGFVEF